MVEDTDIPMEAFERMRQALIASYNPVSKQIVLTQVRFPQSKKKRIRKKWAQYMKNYEISVEVRNEPPV